MHPSNHRGESSTGCGTYELDRFPVFLSHHRPGGPNPGESGVSSGPGGDIITSGHRYGNRGPAPNQVPRKALKKELRGKRARTRNRLVGVVYAIKGSGAREKLVRSPPTKCQPGFKGGLRRDLEKRGHNQPQCRRRTTRGELARQGGRGQANGWGVQRGSRTRAPPESQRKPTPSCLTGERNQPTILGPTKKRRPIGEAPTGDNGPGRRQPEKTAGAPASPTRHDPGVTAGGRPEGPGVRTRTNRGRPAPA